MKLVITGHRPQSLGGHGPGVEHRLYCLAFEMLKAAKPSLVLSGMALGWDQAVALACMDLAIPFDAYVPFAGQESRWPKETQAEYAGMLRRARRIVTCSPGEYAGWKMMHRNKVLIRDSDKIAALYDGSGQGGTAQAVAYAESIGKPVVNLWGEWQTWARS